jgi:copper homeostasis protein (lipoprotein)
MKNYIILFFASLIFLFACSGKPQTETEAEADKTEASMYAGVYGGILPCADCEGIDTELTLNEDNTFTFIEFYLNKSESDLFLTEGSWETEGSPAHIALKESATQGAPRKLYFAPVMHGQNRDLIMLDQNARPIKSDLNYTLLRK